MWHPIQTLAIKSQHIGTQCKNTIQIFYYSNRAQVWFLNWHQFSLEIIGIWLGAIHQQGSCLVLQMMMSWLRSSTWEVDVAKRSELTSLSSRHHHYHHTKNLKKWILNDEVVGRKVPNVLNHFSSLLIACCTVKMMIGRRFLYWFFVVNWFFVFCCWYKIIQWKKNIVML